VFSSVIIFWVIYFWLIEMRLSFDLRKKSGLEKAILFSYALLPVDEVERARWKLDTTGKLWLFSHIDRLNIVRQVCDVINNSSSVEDEFMNDTIELDPKMLDAIRLAHNLPMPGSIGSLEAFNALAEKFGAAWRSPGPKSATMALLRDRFESCALQLQEERIGLRYDEETLTLELESELEPHDHIPYVFLFTDRAHHILAVENATPLDKWKEVWEGDVFKERREAMLLVDQKLAEWVPPENTAIHELIKNRHFINTGELLHSIVDEVLPYDEAKDGPIKATLKYKGKRKPTEELLAVRDVVYSHHRAIIFIDLFGKLFNFNDEVTTYFEKLRKLYGLHRSYYLAKDQRDLLKLRFNHAWAAYMIPPTRPNQTPAPYVVPKKPFSARAKVRELIADGTIKAPEVIWVAGRTSEERRRLGDLRTENERKWEIWKNKVKSEPTVDGIPCTLICEFDDDESLVPPIESPAPLVPPIESLAHPINSLLTEEEIVEEDEQGKKNVET
jgi:hypothetical protein